MSIQYSDTHFSENMPFDDAIARFTECLQNGVPIQALHVGSVREIEQRKSDLLRKANLQEQVDDLREKLESMSVTPVSKILHIPTNENVRKFAKKI